MNEDKIQELKDIVAVQGLNGNWDYNEEMYGMYNGMELMLSIVEERDPVYRDRPDKWISEGNF